MSDLNTRARDALRGEWLPGMVDTMGRRVDAIDDGQPCYRRGVDQWLCPMPADACPDLDDPVTALALLVVLRRRLGAPLAQVSPALDDGAFWVCHLNDGSDRSFRGPTEVEALIAALEDANG